jgi:peptidoglycan/LPS O-acetylase OafA/YrhL
LGHRPALDGLRGVAILLVLVGHFAPEGSATRELAPVGVTLFFALSGFLITASLLEEDRTKGAVSLSAFYVRRARRLLPALLVMVPIVGIFQAAAGVAPLSVTGWALTYLGNVPLSHGADFGLLLHTWSLAIEEQFYLVWPVMFVLVRRWRTGPLLTLLISAAVVDVLWRASLVMGGASAARVYYGSDMWCSALLVGCALAVALHRGIQLRVRSATVARVLTHPWLRYLGLRSYGLYLWHYPLVAGVWLVTDSAAPRLLAVGLAFGLAEASWRYVEQPFMRSGHPEEVEVRGQVSGAGLAREHAHHARREAGIECRLESYEVPAVAAQ